MKTILNDVIQRLTGLLLILVLLSPIATAQETSKVIKIGTTRLDDHRWVEVLVGLGTYDDYNLITTSNWGLAAGVELGGDEISPKLSAGFTWGYIFTSSLNLNYYPKRGHRLVFTPEIGLNIVKVLHFTYGYQINQVARFEGGPAPTRHRFSVFLTFPLFDLW